MKKTFCFDIDGVIATLVNDLKYEKAKAVPETIDLINQLYGLGHKIILFTARGTLTKQDWHLVTENQLSDWGVQYHELKFGKPAADYYIDDRLISLTELFKMLNNGDLK